MSTQMVKRYSNAREQSVMGREDSGHADVVIRYRAHHYSNGVLCLNPELGCSLRDNLSVDQCAECQQVQHSTTCLCCMYLFYEPSCSFKFVTVSAANAILSLTGGITSAGRPQSGTTCFIFGKQAIVVEDKLGGSYMLTGLQMFPISL